MKTLNVDTRTHGRVLVREAAGPRAVLVGFHGYMENADIQMDRLLGIPGAERWTLISVQGLHRFYRPAAKVRAGIGDGRAPEVVASWMTRQDREAMIADNIEYADRVIGHAAPTDVPLVTVGFSQGVATAFRCAVRGRRRSQGAVAVGGDVPPELLADERSAFPPSLLLRGERDDWYTAQKLEADAMALETRGVSVRAITYAAGHAWTAAVATEVGTFVELVCGTNA